jgi:hypothetical protein
MNEMFECRDCFYIGPIGLHGNCERCGSKGVVTQLLFGDQWRTSGSRGNDSLALNQDLTVRESVNWFAGRSLATLLSGS